MAKGARFGFVVEYVKDIGVARRFYEEVVGLQVERHHPSFVQFDRFAIASDAPLAGNGAQETFWLVDDAETALRELPAGVEVSFPLRDLPFGRVLGVRNPDGRPCYLLQLANNRPSQAAE